MIEEFCIELPRQVLRNPQPSIVDVGDCGACCIAGILGVSVEQAYEFHLPGRYHSGAEIPKRSAIRAVNMQRSLENSGLAEHVVGCFMEVGSLESRVPEWRAFGDLPYFQAGRYADVFRAFMSAGYYRICLVVDGGKALDAQACGFQPNHWLMLNGVRAVKDSTAAVPGSYVMRRQVRISNSAPSQPRAQWVDVADFLKCWGGMVGVWVKPKDVPLDNKEQQ